MKQQLNLIAKIRDITSILILRTLMPFEVAALEFDDGSRIEEDGTKRHVFDGAGAALISSEALGDNLVLTAHEALLQDETNDLNLCLQVLGVNKAIWSMDAEDLFDRICAVDAAWSLLRVLRLAQPEGDVLALAEKLGTIAHQWAHLRQLQFDGQHISPAQIKLIEQIEGYAAKPTTLSDLVVKLVLQPDPRGSAMSVRFKGGDYDREMPSLDLSWRVASPMRAALPEKATAKKTSRTVLGIKVTGSMLPKPTKLQQEVLDALAGAQIEGREVKLIKRMKPALYQKVSDVLVELGGLWHTAQQAHVFPDGVEEHQVRQSIDDVLAAGEIYTAQDFEFFATQRPEVNRMVMLADLRPGMKVLEPSAGTGAIALAAAEVVGKSNVTCFELMQRNVQTLQALGFAVDGPRDFLEVPAQATFDVVLANPPFSGSKDVAHIEHAMRFLKPGGRLVAICSTSWTHANSAIARAFQNWVDDHSIAVEDIEAGAFRASGTDVATKLLVLQAPRAVAAVQTEESTEALDAAKVLEVDTPRITGKPTPDTVMEELANAFF